MTETMQRIALARRPMGAPVDDDFLLENIPMPTPADGEVLVKVHYMSLDPYMRGRMNDVKSYVPPFQIDEPMTGGAIGEVVESRADSLSPGDRIQHMQGWRDEAVVDASSAQKLPDLPVPESAFLGVFGMPGMTAYFGLLNVGAAKKGETLFVSAAAGAVGSTVVQIAKARGMHVIGSAGGAEKCEWVRSLGADAMIDYKADGPVVKKLMAAAPDGIDVYFDNVGGDHLDAAYATARNHARFALCGMIDMYNSGEPVKLRYLARSMGARIRTQGFIVGDFMNDTDPFYRDMTDWYQAGKLRHEDTIVEGLEKTADAFLGLFTGANKGKMVVKI